ncbi:hypothetical protein [Paraburkholderia sp. GAS334]|uniref:hypothetical protein n=1 Tax=Paraburkholderia sp. GAS334 TaxID=3035131 RepID=UPI003D230451
MATPFHRQTPSPARDERRAVVQPGSPGRAGSIRDCYSDQRRVENERQTALAKAEAAKANEGAELAKADAAQANASAETTRESNLKLQIALKKNVLNAFSLKKKSRRGFCQTQSGERYNQANKVC